MSKASEIVDKENKKLGQLTEKLKTAEKHAKSLMQALEQIKNTNTI